MRIERSVGRIANIGVKRGDPISIVIHRRLLNVCLLSGRRGGWVTKC